MRKLVLVAVCLLNACRGASNRDVDYHVTESYMSRVPVGPEEEFSGLFALGFEKSEFAPLDSDERWWVRDGPSALERQYWEIVGDNEREQVYARVKGRKSELGEYGHLNLYVRLLDITEVIELRAIDRQDKEHLKTK